MVDVRRTPGLRPPGRTSATAAVPVCGPSPTRALARALTAMPVPIGAAHRVLPVVGSFKVLRSLLVRRAALGVTGGVM
jgi:hypothetical protein